MERLPDGVAIVPTATEKSRNADVHYPFRPDSDFWYLTGFAEPEALLVLVPGHPDGEEWLFCRPRDPEREIWDGRRAGLEGARELCGIQQTRSIVEPDSLLPELLQNRELLCAPLGRSADFDARLMLWRNQARSRSRAGIRYPQELVDLGFLLHEMRVIKDPVELEHLRAAVASMKRLNAGAAQAARAAGVRCGTDVTGFGLIGHLLEMAESSGVGFRVRAAEVPLLPGAVPCAAQRQFPGGVRHNEGFFGDRVRAGAGVDPLVRRLLFSPETAGGLLLAVPGAAVERLLADCHRAGEQAWVIGEAVGGDPAVALV
jgi:hypothetical protein